VRRLKDSAFRQLDFIFKALELKAQSTRPTDICKRSRSAGRPDAQALAVTGAPLVRSRRRNLRTMSAPDGAAVGSDACYVGRESWRRRLAPEIGRATVGE
jgi:hypothetical protein